MGAKAADLLCAGASNRVVAWRGGDFVDYDINEALAMKKDIPAYQYEVSKLLVR
jgi:6-phosphofructokinase 1